MKTATSLTLVAAGAIIAFAITAHIAFLNLQVTGWVVILTGVAGAIITRSSWPRRTLAVKGRPGAAAARGTGQHSARAANLQTRDPSEDGGRDERTQAEGTTLAGLRWL
jgi:hypothetical protein